MANYGVWWGIDVDAKNPEQAARLALEIMQDPENTGQDFEVHRGGMKWHVALWPETTVEEVPNGE